MDDDLLHDDRFSRGLDLALADLPTTPAATVLHTARRAARRRRRRTTIGLVAATVLTVGGVAVLGPTGGVVATDVPVGVAPTATPDPVPVRPPVAHPAQVDDGLGTLDHDPDATAPDGVDRTPVAITPDGRLWVAPDATVLRSVAEPFGTGPLAGQPDFEIVASYAVEVAWQGQTRWFTLDRTRSVSGGGLTDGLTRSRPSRLLDDFGTWVEDVVYLQLQQPDVGQRLVSYDGASTTLVAQPGVEIVQQREVTHPPDWAQYDRTVAAEVRWRGRTWWVDAGQDPPPGQTSFRTFTADAASDFADFVGQVEAGISTSVDDSGSTEGGR